MLQPVLIRSSNKHDGLNWYKHIQDPHTWSSPIWRRCCPFIHDSLTLSNTAALLVMRSRLKRSDRSFTCQEDMAGGCFAISVCARGIDKAVLGSEGHRQGSW